MSGIFISYRESDAKAWAISLRDELAVAFGESRIFLDKDTLQAGDWHAQLRKALEQCKVVLVVMGRDWLAAEDDRKRKRLWLLDDVHRQEVAFALSQRDVIVIPVRVDGAAMPRRDDLPEDLVALANQQSREIGDSRARRKVDVAVLIQDIELATGLKATVGNGGQEQQREHVSRHSIQSKGWIETIAVAGLLSLAISALFSMASMGLGAQEVSVVVLVSLLVSLGGRKLFLWLRRRKLSG